jgi:hypothetical protein|nr:hypothetical protein [Aeromicrobium sp.]
MHSRAFDHDLGAMAPRPGRSRLLLGLIVCGLLLLPSAAHAGAITLKPGKHAVKTSRFGFTNGSASATFLVPAFKGPSVHLGLQLRGKGNGNAYRARLKVERDGDAFVGISRTKKSGDKRLTSIKLPGRMKRGQRVVVNASVTGSKTVRIAVRAWVKGKTRPGWQRSYADTSRKRITGWGRVAAWGHLPKKATSNAKLTFGKVRGKASPKRASASGAKPSAATTGVPSGTRLTRHNGNIVVTKDGTHLDGLDIYGFVDIKAKNVTISNSRIRGGQATGNRGIVMNLGSPNFVIRDSEISPQYPSVRLDGLLGWNFSAQRLHIDGGVDSIKVIGSNVRIADSLLENTDHFASDPFQGGGPTHNDNIQMLTGTNVAITGNTIRGAQTHTVLSQAAQGEGQVLIANNWLDGAICNVKLQRKNGHHLDGTVTGNKFGANRVWQKCKISAQSGGGVSISQNTNTMEVGGAAVGVMWER